MSDASSADILPAALALLGGIPLRSQDLAASIIFTLAYFALALLGLWRWSLPRTRTSVLVRPLIFSLIRLATYAIRVVQSTGNYSIGLFIAEQVLLLSGFILLIEPLLSLTFLHVTRFDEIAEHSGRLERLFRWLRLLIVASLVLGIYAGTQYGSLDQNGVLTRVKVCRDVNVIICLVVTLFAGGFVFARQVRNPRLPKLQSVHLIAISVILTLASGYRLELYANDDVPNSLAAGTKAGYYLLSALPEFLATLLYTAVDLNKVYEIPAAKLRVKQAKMLKKSGGVCEVEDGQKLESV